MVCKPILTEKEADGQHIHKGKREAHYQHQLFSKFGTYKNHMACLSMKVLGSHSSDSVNGF